MILHIAYDEKFIDMAYRSFESALPGENHFIVVSNTPDLRYVKGNFPEILTPDELLSKDFINSCKKFDFVILHSLAGFALRFVNKAPKAIKILWIGFGFDYYHNFPDGFCSLLLPKTLRLFKSKQTFLLLLRSRLGIIKRLLKNEYNLFHKNLFKIDFFAPVLPDEYKLCKKNLPTLRAKFISWNYGNLEDDLTVKGLRISGNNILLGNSASYTNNHIDAIDKLAVDIKKLPGKIITPLSYGDNDYRDEVIKYGKEKLGDMFVPLTEFLPVKEYWEKIASCRYVIMNHLRQQAMGNIVMMMNLGASVFLQSQNPAFKFFHSNKAHFFSVDNISDKKDFSLFNLNEKQKNENKLILQKYWSRDNILKRTKCLIDKVNKN